MVPGGLGRGRGVRLRKEMLIYLLCLPFPFLSPFSANPPHPLGQEDCEIIVFYSHILIPLERPSPYKYGSYSLQ